MNNYSSLAAKHAIVANRFQMKSIQQLCIPLIFHVPGEPLQVLPLGLFRNGLWIDPGADAPWETKTILTVTAQVWGNFGNFHHQTVFYDSSWGSNMTRLDSLIVAACQLSWATLFSVFLRFYNEHDYIISCFLVSFCCKVFHFETWRNWLEFVQESSLWNDLKWRTASLSLVHFLTQFWGVSPHGSGYWRQKQYKTEKCRRLFHKNAPVFIDFTAVTFEMQQSWGCTRGPPEEHTFCHFKWKFPMWIPWLRRSCAKKQLSACHRFSTHATRFLNAAVSRSPRCRLNSQTKTGGPEGLWLPTLRDFRHHKQTRGCSKRTSNSK